MCSSRSVPTSKLLGSNLSMCHHYPSGGDHGSGVCGHSVILFAESVQIFSKYQMTTVIKDSEVSFLERVPTKLLKSTKKRKKCHTPVLLPTLTENN